MFIVKTGKQLLEFNLHDDEDVKKYSELISDPAINVIDKRFEQMTQSEIQGDSISKWTELHVYVEVERCQL